MVPSLSKVFIFEDKFPRQKFYYHGRRKKGNDFHEDRPAFFSLKKDDCEFYSEGYREAGAILKCQLTFKKAATRIDLTRIAQKELGLTIADAERARGKTANFDVSGAGSDTDFVYVEKVRRELERQGFDAYSDWDTLMEDKIDIMVVWHPRQIRVVEEMEGL